MTPRSPRRAGPGALLATLVTAVLVLMPLSAVAAPEVPTPSTTAEGTVEPSPSGTTSTNGPSSAPTSTETPDPPGPVGEVPAEEGVVTLTVAEVTPTVAGPDDVVTVSGVLHNGTGEPLPTPTLSLVTAEADLTSRDDVAAWAEGTEPATGERIARTKLDGDLAPGASVSFTLTAEEVAGLGEASYGSVPVSVQGAGEVQHTFLGYQRTKQYVPMSTTWLFPLTLQPRPELFGAPSAERRDAWAEVTADDGRISRIIDATAERDVAWALDPTLVTAPAAPDEEEPADLGAETVEAIESRRAFAAEVTAATREQTTIVLPYADADVAAAQTAPETAAILEQQVRHAIRANESVEGRVDIAWPATPPATAKQHERVASLYPDGLAATIVSSATLPPSPFGFTPSAAHRSASGDAVLVRDEQLSDLMRHVDTGQASVLAAQRLIADTALLVDERSGTERSLLVAAPRGFSPDVEGLGHVLDTASDVPWLAPASLDDLIAAAQDAVPAEPPAPITPPRTPGEDDPGQHPSLLTAESAETIRDSLREVRTMSSVRDDGERYAARWTTAARQLTSVRWRTEPETWTAELGDVRAAAVPAESLEVSPGNINFFAESGRLQVTVINHLDVGVHAVHVELEPQSPRLRLEPITDPIRIGPESRATVTVEATALASGLVPIEAHLVTPDGTPIGQPAVVEVRVSPTGPWIYWAIGGLAALLLVVGLWRTLRGERRRRADPVPAEVRTAHD